MSLLRKMAMQFGYEGREAEMVAELNDALTGRKPAQRESSRGQTEEADAAFLNEPHRLAVSHAHDHEEAAKKKK